MDPNLFGGIGAKYTPYFVAGIATLIIGAMLTMVWRMWKAMHVIKWVPLPGWHVGAQWYSNVESVRPEILVEALRLAENALIGKTRWRREDLAEVGQSAKIFISDSETWKDLNGTEVAGQQVNDMIIVGPSLAALGHELAHLCEQLIDRGAVDYGHTFWRINGVDEAVEFYEAWIKRRAAADRVASGAVGSNVVSIINTCRYSKLRF